MSFFSISMDFQKELSLTLYLNFFGGGGDEGPKRILAFDLIFYLPSVFAVSVAV